MFELERYFSLFFFCFQIKYIVTQKILENEILKVFNNFSKYSNQQKLLYIIIIHLPFNSFFFRFPNKNCYPDTDKII